MLDRVEKRVVGNAINQILKNFLTSTSTPEEASNAVKANIKQVFLILYPAPAGHPDVPAYINSVNALEIEIDGNPGDNRVEITILDPDPVSTVSALGYRLEYSTKGKFFKVDE